MNRAGVNVVRDGYPMRGIEYSFLRGMVSSDTTGDTGGNSRLSLHANCIATTRGKYRGGGDPHEVARNIAARNNYMTGPFKSHFSCKCIYDDVLLENRIN